MGKANTISGGILLAIAAGYAYEITQLPQRNLPNTMGADFMPIVFDIALGLLSLALIVQGIRGQKEGDDSSKLVPLTGREVLGIVFVFALFFAYIFLINLIGFLIATPLVLLALVLMQGIRRPVPIILVCVGVTVVVYLLFRYLFSVQIPGIAFLF